MKPSHKTDLADPTGALASYLDELLLTATDAARQSEVEPAPAAKPDSKPEPEPRPQTVTRPEPKPAPRTVAEQPKVVTAPERPVVAVPEPAPAAEVVTPEPVAAPVPATKARPPEVSRKAIQQPVDVARTVEAQKPDVPAGGQPVGRPDWSESPFECLIFRVAGLQLAVPLILLGAIHRLEQGVKPIPGSPRWYMGMLPDKDHNLRVVDSAEWIMAGRVPAEARDNYRFVIRLDNSEWALACDEVAQSFTLKPEDVRWRTSRSKRPWLAGTVINQMCALIDVGAMAQLLARAEREHHLSLE